MDDKLRQLYLLEEEFCQLLEREDDLLVKVGGRTLQELVLHLLGWDLTTLVALQQALAGIDPAMVDDEVIPKFNLAAVKLWGDLGLKSTVTVYKTTSRWLFQTYAKLVEANTFPLPNWDVDPIGDDIAHYQEHVAELRMGAA